MTTCQSHQRHDLRHGVISPFVLLALAPDTACAAAPALDGTSLRWPWALPFIGILLTIATGPLLFPRIWHHHYGKLAFVWSVLTVAPLAALYGTPTAFAAFVHAMLAEYLSFIVLLFALYVVAGGILVTGNLRGTPLVNTAILTIGTLIASVVGTTGAAMILIRPLIRANAARLHNVHVFVFFIFLVANIGGALSPLGDPPLFVGFLHGVDFFWTAQHLWIETALVAGAVLAIFCCSTSGITARTGWSRPSAKRRRPMNLGVSGSINFLLIAGIIAAILCSATWKPGINFDVYGTSARAAEPRARRRAAAARHPVARAHAERAPRGQRLTLGTRSRRWRSCSPASSPASFRCWRCSTPARSGAFAWLLSAVTRRTARRTRSPISG